MFRIIPPGGRLRDTELHLSVWSPVAVEFGLFAGMVRNINLCRGDNPSLLSGRTEKQNWPLENPCFIATLALEFDQSSFTPIR